MSLPQKLTLDAMQNTWASALNPIIASPQNNSIILKNIALAVGVNVISHKLGRNLQGWNPTRIRAATVIYDQQDTNQTPQLTLVLISSAAAVVDLEVF